LDVRLACVFSFFDSVIKWRTRPASSRITEASPLQNPRSVVAQTGGVCGFQQALFECIKLGD
jgi:hypothetical protein